MSYLIRVFLPDTPGSLGRLAEEIGLVDGNINSVDIVETFPDGTVVDDIVVTLPGNPMADVLITAATSVPGVTVDSIRPFYGRVDRRGQIAMLADVAAHHQSRARALDSFVTSLPTSMTASWAIVVETGPQIRRVASSPAAPEDDGTEPESIDVEAPRMLDPESDSWIPESWAVLEPAFAAAPLPGTDLVLIVARTGDRDFLPGEVTQLSHLATIVGALLR